MCAALTLDDAIYSEYGNDANVRVVTFKRYRGVMQPSVPAVYVGPVNHLVRNYQQFVELFMMVHDYHVGMPNLFGLVVTGHAGLSRPRRTYTPNAGDTLNPSGTGQAAPTVGAHQAATTPQTDGQRTLAEELGIDGGDQGPGFIFPPSDNEGALAAADAVAQQNAEIAHRIHNGRVMLCVMRAFTDGRMEDITAETRFYIVRPMAGGANRNQRQRVQGHTQRYGPAEQINGAGDGPQ